VEIGKDDVYNRVYAYPKILKLIETSYLAITVLDREGRVVAFAAFEDAPQGLRGMYDEKHYNYWESWFREAYGLEEFSSFNTVWLNYFVAGGNIPYEDWRHIFKKVLRPYTPLLRTESACFSFSEETQTKRILSTALDHSGNTSRN